MCTPVCDLFQTNGVKSLWDPKDIDTGEAGGVIEVFFECQVMENRRVVSDQTDETANSVYAVA